MTYCKYCGMESKTADACEWCRRSLRPTAPPPASSAASPIRSASDIVAEADETARKNLVAFFICCGILMLLTFIMVGIRFSLYPYMAIGSMLAAGILLGYFGIIPPFEQEWSEIGVPLILLIIFPAIFVYIGYVIYGLITRQMDLTFVWLMSVAIGMMFVLEIGCAVIGMISQSTVSFITFKGVEILGFIAVLGGWMISGSFGCDRAA
jgi:hypothetical protein